jgi:hypothetical protein
MSTGCNCSFEEVEPGKWWYVLEDTYAPKNSWDWREYADAYGPFSTLDIAVKHLHDNHANPGGWSEYSYNPENPYKADEVMTRLMADAAKRKAEESRPMRPIRLGGRLW